MSEPVLPPVAFHFTVSFANGQGRDFACQEVSGLDRQIGTEPLAEGGENRFAHRLPKPVKRSNLKLKRILTSQEEALVTWCKATLDAGLSAQIETRDLTIALLNESGVSVANWQVKRAYPVSWSVGAFDAMKNELAIETVELAYADLTRSI